MKTRKTLAGITVIALLSGSVFFSPAVAEDDVYYLENEIRETDAKWMPLATDIVKIENFLGSYDRTMDDLKSAYDEISALGDKARTRLAGNLLKSSVLASMDLFSALTLPLGVYKQAVKVVVLSVVVEVASNYMQSTFSDSYYNRAMAPLSKHAQGLLPEIEELQRTIQLTIGDIKAMSRLEGKELEETGAVYRKFQMILEGVEKAKKAILKLSTELTRVKAELSASLEQIKPEAARLKEKLDGLQARLSVARQEKRRTEMAEEVAGVKERVKPSHPPAVPSIAAKDPQEAFKQWLGVFTVAEKTLRDKVPGLAQQVAENRKKLDDDWLQLLQGLAARNIIQLGYGNVPSENYWLEMPQERSPDGMTLTQMVEWHAGAKKAGEFLKGAVSDVRSALSSADSFKDRIVDIATREEELQALRKYAQEVELARLTIYPGSVDHQHDATRIFRELLPPGFSVDVRTIDKTFEVAGLRELLVLYDSRIPTMLEIYDKNAQGFEKAVPPLVKAYEARYAKLMEDLTNADNALTQLQDVAAQYDKAVIASQWYAKRNPGADQWYYSTAKSGMAENLQVQFNEKAFLVSLSEAVAKDDPKAADDLMKKFEKLAEDYKALERKYNAAWLHYTYYCDEAASDIGIFMYDMKSASEVKDAILKVPALDAGKAESLYANTVKFRSVWSGLRSLPNVDIDLDGIPAYRAYRLRARIAREKQSWMGLKSDEFYRKTGEIGAEIAQLPKSGQDAAIADVVRKDLDNVIREYRLAHGEAEELPAPGSSKPATDQVAAVSLTDMKLNGAGLGNAYGDLVLARDDLKGGVITITATVAPIDAVEDLQISEDGKGTWQKLPKKEKVSYSITPSTGRRYKPAIRIRNRAGHEFVFEVFPGIQSISYDDRDYKTVAVDMVRKLASAYEAKNASAFTALVSRDFIGNRTFLEDGIRRDFDTFDAIRLSLFVNRTEKQRDLYMVETKWDKTQSVRKTGKQQRTTGNTTMMFGLEDGAMKLRNLRGDLVFATLSPEIAESSGLSGKVIDAVAKAASDGTGAQPGAGGGDTGSQGAGAQPATATLQAGTFTLTQYKLPHPPNFDIEGYNFSSRSKTRETSPFPVQSDFRRREGWVESRGGIVDLGPVGLDNVTEAPASGYTDAVGGAPGRVYAVRVTGGTYALVETMSLADVFNTPNTSTFRYKYQRNGTRSFK